MARLVLDEVRQSKPRAADAMVGSVLTERQDLEITFAISLVALLPFLRRCAQRLTRDREQALDLVQDTCEKALRFRHLFQAGTSMRAWLWAIMRHHFFDMAKRRRDAMGPGRCAPLEAEYCHSAARAEQICFTKELLQLAAQVLSEEQASVFWPTLYGATRRECAALPGVSKGTVGTRLHRARSAMRRASAA